jgi:hypothetical protein
MRVMRVMPCDVLYLNATKGRASENAKRAWLTERSVFFTSRRPQTRRIARAGAQGQPPGLKTLQRRLWDFHLHGRNPHLLDGPVW